MPNPHQNDVPIPFTHGMCKIIGNEGSGAYRITEQRWTGSAWTNGSAPGAVVAPTAGTANAYDVRLAPAGVSGAFVPFWQVQKSTGGRAYIIDTQAGQPQLFAVKVWRDGGTTDGDKTNDCDRTYTARTIDATAVDTGGVLLGEDMTPLKRRPAAGKLSCAPVDGGGVVGLGYYYGGTFYLFDANETLAPQACP